MQKEKAAHFGLFVVAGKLGPKFASLFAKLFKLAKSAKVVGAAGSAAAYSYLLSWEFCAIIMGMLFVHESGHVWAMRDRGIKTKGFYFVPLLGGAAVAEESFKTRANESYIALMGPFWALFLAIASFAAFWATNLELLAAATAWIALVNLFNLLPINPLDGGRVLKSVAFSATHGVAAVIFLLTTILAMIFSLASGAVLFSVMGVIGFFEIWNELGQRGSVLAVNPIVYFVVRGLSLVFKVLVLPAFIAYCLLKKKQPFLPSVKDFFTTRSYETWKMHHAVYQRELIQQLRAYESLENAPIEKIQQLRDPNSLLLAKTGIDTVSAKVGGERFYPFQLDLRERDIRKLSELVPMTRRESLISIFAYFGLIALYATMMWALRDYPDVNTAIEMLH